MRKLWLTLVIALLLAGQFVAPVTAATTASTCGDIYWVQPGDYLAKIANQCGMTVYEILVRNPQIWNPNLIYYGQVLRLTEDPVTSVPPTGGGNWYIVQSGDTMKSIADRIGTDVWTLMSLNPQIWNPWWIYPDQAILLPPGTSIPASGGGIPATTSSKVTLSAAKVPPGGSLTVNVTGFPANTNILFQAGKQGDGYVISVNAKTDANGNAGAVVTMSPSAVLNENWILLVQTTGVMPATMAVSPSITIGQ